MPALVWAYVSAVFLFGERHLPFEFGLGLWILSIVLVLIAGSLLFRWMLRRRLVSTAALTNLSILGVTSVLGLLVLDVAYSAYLNSNDSSFDLSKSRVFDENIWVGELYPRVFYPTEKNFALHKPGVQVAGSPFGNFYSPPMKASPMLVESVLRKQPVSIQINALGFRESSDITVPEIFALGDSFTFGWGVSQEDSWPGLLEHRLDRPIYNLGIHDASPKQELELLKYMLQKHGDRMRMRRLLWMFYEGNDLEDDYTELVQRQDVPVPTPVFQGTLIEAMEGVLRAIQRQSVINRLRHGQIALKKPAQEETGSPYHVDGVNLAYPLYHSSRLGSRLFYQYYVDLAGESASYVANHWNREALVAVFREMRMLATEHGFEVAVIIAPSAARLHGPYFEDFPEISEQPHFINFLKDLAVEAQFETVDLYELMKPYAGTELYYFRDDDHFNQRGNSLAASLIQQQLFATTE